MTTYDHTIPERDEVARFLERTTFGTRKSDLDGWASNDTAAYANYVQDQISNIGTSSHREFYRKRLTPRSTETYIYGIPGPKACEANSRWRRFAFTKKVSLNFNHHFI